jgi:hypothetical protein
VSEDADLLLLFSSCWRASHAFAACLHVWGVAATAVSAVGNGLQEAPAQVSVNVALLWWFVVNDVVGFRTRVWSMGFKKRQLG